MGPYHLEVKGEKCDPSYNQWVQLWKLLSCSYSAHVDSIDISLNDLIKKTKWYLEDDIMIGILMVANSKQVIPFIEDTWYLAENDLLCSCEACASQKLRRQVDKVHYPTMLDHFDGRMLTIPPGMDAFVFPVNRISGTSPCPIQYFYKLENFLKKCVREGIVPEKYFKMPNTVGMGNARCLPSAFTSKSVKQKLDDQGSQGGSYTPLVTLIHRIVYVYTKGKPIFISMIHPSGFVVSCYGLMEWITALENYSVDLRDIYFLFYGLKLAASKTLKEPTCISCLQLKTAIEEKIPLVDGAAGASGVLFSFRTAFYARKIWGNQIGRSNFSDSEDY